MMNYYPANYLGFFSAEYSVLPKAQPAFPNVYEDQFSH